MADGVDNLPQHPGEEVHEDAVLPGKLQAEGLDGLHHHDLELVRDLRDEGGDLLHEAVHRRLCARLEERGDGQRGDGAVRVGDEVLQVEVAGGDGRGVRHRDLSSEE